MRRSPTAPALPPMPRHRSPSALVRLAARWQDGWEVYASALGRAESRRAELPWPADCDFRLLPPGQRCSG